MKLELEHILRSILQPFESCNLKIFVLIVYKNITKNNKLLSLAIQDKNIKTNISHPPQRKKI
jgi:hypothetical protein